MVSIRWTGAAGLEFTHNGQTILVDPYHSRVGKFDVLFKRLMPNIPAIENYLKEIPGKLSAIIVGHTHFDHALDVPAFSKHFDGPVIGSISLENLMVRSGMPGRVTTCERGKRIELPGNAAVSMIPSIHGLVAFGRIPYPRSIDPNGRIPLKAREYRHGEVYIAQLEVAGTIFMHSGSANLIESELNGHKCDVLFMGVPGWKKVPEYTTHFLEIVKPRMIVPFHFDDFTTSVRPHLKPRNLPLTDLTGFMMRIKQSAPDIEIRVMRPFETMTF